MAKASTNEATAASSSPPPQPVHKDEATAEKLCKKWVQSGLTGNNTIQFLLQHLIDLGCTPPDRFIKCLSCDRPGAGFFGMVIEEEQQPQKQSQNTAAINENNNEALSECSRIQANMMKQNKEAIVAASPHAVLKPEIYICQQYMKNESMTHKTMAHELIHAIDQCRTNMDPLNNCLHISCTEVRAENLSGECGFWSEFPRIKAFAGHGKECVRRRAILSVRGNPKCAERAEDYVDAVLPRCFQDVYPFERHPNQR